MNKLEAINIIRDNIASFVICNKDYHDIGIGVKPIIKVIDNDSLLLNDAYIVDKIIGKASAMLLVKYHINKVHGLLMSEKAIEIFEFYNIDYSYDSKCANIINREQSGLCPLEDSVINLKPIELDKAELNIRKRISELMSKKI